MEEVLSSTQLSEAPLEIGNANDSPFLAITQPFPPKVLMDHQIKTQAPTNFPRKWQQTSSQVTANS